MKIVYYESSHKVHICDDDYNTILPLLNVSIEKSPTFKDDLDLCVENRVITVFNKKDLVKGKED